MPIELHAFDTPNGRKICVAVEYRRDAEHFLEAVRDRGDIHHIVKWVQERRARRGY